MLNLHNGMLLNGWPIIIDHNPNDKHIQESYVWQELIQGQPWIYTLLYLVITVSADVLAPQSAKHLARTVIT